ncbi:MAG: ABC transporter permease [Campylobacterales bacterium]|nr:ABC transporter permease [Campylobacterales bacterium]
MFSLVLKIALKSAFIRPLRSFLTVLMIALSMSVMITLEGFYDGMVQSMTQSVIRSQSGDLSLFAKGYRLHGQIDYRIEEAKALTQSLREHPQVDAAVMRLEAQGLAQTAHKASGATLIGIDVLAEERFGGFSEFVVDGTLDSLSHGAAIGSALAKRLKVRIGSKVVLSVVDQERTIQSIALRIKAVVRTSNIARDERALFVDYPVAAALLGVSPESATQIALRCTEPHALQTHPDLRALESVRFEALHPQLAQMRTLTDLFNTLSFGIVMSVVFIGILGTMYVSVLERIREFGMLLCIGYGFGRLCAQVLFEALALSLAGFALGALLSFGLLLYLYVYGLDLSAFAQGLERFGLFSVLYAPLDPGYFLSTLYAVIGAASLSVIAPLRRIAKLTPVEVLKEYP